MVHHPFDPDHPLRASKAAIGGGALGVGFQTVAFDADIGQVIAIVRMQHGAIGHGQRQVLRPAAAEKVGELEPQHAALIVDPGAVADAQIVALSGDHHVVVAVIAHLAGPARGAGGDGAGDGKGVALAFLAAKAPAHPPHLDPDRIHRQVQGMGDLVLDFRRMLGRGMDHHIPALLWQGGCDLAFQIEMLLPADLERPFDHLRGVCDGGCGIALGPGDGAGFKAAVGGKRVVDRQDCRSGSIGYPAQTGCAAGGKVAVGHHKKHGLADVMHGSGGEQRLVMRRWAAIGHIGQVFGTEHGDDARGSAHV